ncbi:hypothetical protein Dimus_022755 [Dionaea muscipula]
MNMSTFKKRKGPSALIQESRHPLIQINSPDSAQKGSTGVLHKFFSAWNPKNHPSKMPETKSGPQESAKYKHRISKCYNINSVERKSMVHSSQTPYKSSHVICDPIPNNNGSLQLKRKPTIMQINPSFLLSLYITKTSEGKEERVK